MQTTNTVLMIRPARVAFNPDTAINNRFQRPPLDPLSVQHNALEEFDGYVEALRNHGVEVRVPAATSRWCACKPCPTPTNAWPCDAHCVTPAKTSSPSTSTSWKPSPATCSKPTTATANRCG